jgi:hypothetical protein
MGKRERGGIEGEERHTFYGSVAGEVLCHDCNFRGRIGVREDQGGC